jgi:hypothetical protein
MSALVIYTKTHKLIIPYPDENEAIDAHQSVTRQRSTHDWVAFKTGHNLPFIVKSSDIEAYSVESNDAPGWLLDQLARNGLIQQQVAERAKALASKTIRL